MKNTSENNGVEEELVEGIKYIQSYKHDESFWPTLLYGVGIDWKLHKKMQEVEMKYLRRAANVTVMDKRRNENIRESI